MIATTLKVLSPVRHLQRLMLKYAFATELIGSFLARNDFTTAPE